MPRQMFMKAIGFTKVDQLEKYIDKLGQGNFKLQRDKSPKLDLGETATIKNNKRNKTPSKLPDHYSNVWHCDIGPCRAVGGAFGTHYFS